MQLNENIRLYLKVKGYTQEGLGDSLKMCQSTFSRVLKKPIPDSLLVRIARALNATPEVLQNYHLPPGTTPRNSSRKPSPFNEMS